MANLITLSRLLLLFVVLWIAHLPPSWWQLTAVALLIVVFVTDALDGYVARKRNEETVFGAMFDIAVDRIVELCLWIAVANLDLAPVWVALLFVVRGSLVDAIRARQVAESGAAPFDMLRHPLAQWLVAGRFIRGFYAAIKAITFCWLLLFMPFPHLLPDLLPGVWEQWGFLPTLVGQMLIGLSVILCLARGLPVILEFMHNFRDQR